MTFAFEKLLVYQKSVDFADAICDLTEQFPARYNHLADQVNRASLSIASNIAEGNGRFTKPDRKHFFGIARGSVQECVPQLELARRRKLVSDEHHAKLKQQLEEISRMLSGHNTQRSVGFSLAFLCQGQLGQLTCIGITSQLGVCQMEVCSYQPSQKARFTKMHTRKRRVTGPGGCPNSQALVFVGEDDRNIVTASDSKSNAGRFGLLRYRILTRDCHENVPGNESTHWTMPRWRST